MKVRHHGLGHDGVFPRSLVCPFVLQVLSRLLAGDKIACRTAVLSPAYSIQYSMGSGALLLVAVSAASNVLVNPDARRTHCR